MTKQVGIYQMTSPTGAVYIGQSRDMVKRKESYKNMRCKNQPRIYNSLVGHGFDAHNFTVIHELPVDVGQEVINEYEIFCISQFKEAGINVMNLTSGGSTKYGLSEESRKRLSDSHKGIYPTEASRKKLSETHKRKYAEDPIGYAAIKSKAGRNQIITEESKAKRVATRRLKDNYKKKPESIAKFRLTIAAKKAAGFKKNQRKDSERVSQYTTGGVLIKEYSSFTEAEQLTGICSGNISLAASGKRKSAGGFIWKRITGQ